MKRSVTKFLTLIIYAKIIILVSCSTKSNVKFPIDRTSPTKTIQTFIELINNNRISSSDSVLLCNPSSIDFVLNSNCNKDSKSNIRIDFLETLEKDSTNAIVRVKLSYRDSARIVNDYDKLLTLSFANNNWMIQKVGDFSFNKQTDLSEQDALSSIYGNQIGKFEIDSGYRSPLVSLNLGNKYILLSTINLGDLGGTGCEQQINGAILRWNGVKWVVDSKKDSILTSFESNHGGIHAKVAYFQKNNSPFFLLCDYQEGELGVTSNYQLLDLSLNMIYSYNVSDSISFSERYNETETNRKKNQITLPQSYKYYTYENYFGAALSTFSDLNNIETHFRVDENNEKIYIEVWYTDHKEIMAEGGLISDPNNPNNLLFDGYWYNKHTGFKGTYNHGKLIGNDIMRAFTNNEIGEKCQWCKTGVIVNGYCELCGVPSSSTRNNLNKNIDIQNFNSNNLDCKNRMNHNKFRYPDECPLCGYKGLIK